MYRGGRGRGQFAYSTTGIAKTSQSDIQMNCNQPLQFTIPVHTGYQRMMLFDGLAGHLT